MYFLHDWQSGVDVTKAREVFTQPLDQGLVLRPRLDGATAFPTTQVYTDKSIRLAGNLDVSGLAPISEVR